MATQRCLVPADGFYEWRRDGNRKIPMWITLKSREPFAFPGLWDCWVDRDSGSQLYTFTIITTRANALVQRIHDRMPVIYDAAMGRQWLEGPFGGRAMALDLVLQPLPSERMEAHEVSTLVNSPENDTAECVQLVSPSRAIKEQLPLILRPPYIVLWIAAYKNPKDTVIPLRCAEQHCQRVRDENNRQKHAGHLLHNALLQHRLARIKGAETTNSMPTESKEKPAKILAHVPTMERAQA